ncbi:phosphatidate cytidylyltransferase, mitochondrial-like isoform X4 [Vigna unguiculata]|uniref:phosphatidate cytidylyltransferase, mitochondrial-like isoform X4 n=1 Tax=Vigna unguiculata TaxID=3917 RepID=UPI001015D243|nr:phosphatidate cytidylyltransferase, mitochondrial-like isoform X4 [Vigna unguiculata]
MVMDNASVRSFLQVLPPVEFACVYGSSLHPSNRDKTTMTDYIIGVADPKQWHSENLKLNKHHYASWMVHLGGERLITGVADKIGMGVHFNPFVCWNGKLFKYGVVRMHDLLQDVHYWEKFYLCGRLQKPVHVVVDNLDVNSTNSVNLRAAVSAALLLLPSEFTEADLYAKVCSLSSTGDVRMLFAEDKNKDFDLSVDSSLVSALPPSIRNQIRMKGVKEKLWETGRAINDTQSSLREEAANSLQRILRRRVMVSSARQAVSGLLAVGAINASRYLTKKVSKAWKSWR